MTTTIRKSLYELQDAYDAAESSQKGQTELVQFILAYQVVQKLSPDDTQSFFKIAGYHGAPFRGAGWGNNQWWGGYCHHGNILFPTWHRAYVLELEKALHEKGGLDQAIGFPYWDQTDDRAVAEGLPHIITDEKVDIGNNQRIPNPLRSYTFPESVYDNATPSSESNYTKPITYTTVRYPYSGLVGSPADAEATAKHNEQMDQDAAAAGVTTDTFLNRNIIYWLKHNPNPKSLGIYEKYKQCLKAPNYTVFSNTTSAAQYNQQNEGKIGAEYVVPIESPHNSMHLSIGGIDLPGYEWGLIEGANGDMGENDTAAFDPVFFFHHCFIDKVFWDWQVQNNQTGELIIEPGYERYPGTNSVDSQGPTPWVPGNVLLTLDTNLEPFKKSETEYYTSKDVTNIENLGYEYQERVVVEPLPILPPPQLGRPIKQHKAIIPHRLPTENLNAPARLVAPIIRISGINRTQWRGSFALVVQVKVKKEDGTENWIVVNAEGILSRWNVGGCANCQAHLNVLTYQRLPPVFSREFLADLAANEQLENYISVSIRHKVDSEESKKRRLPVGEPPAFAPIPSDSKNILKYHRHWNLVSHH